jgi:hypothetical protein
MRQALRGSYSLDHANSEKELHVPRLMFVALHKVELLDANGLQI